MGRYITRRAGGPALLLLLFVVAACAASAEPPAPSIETTITVEQPAAAPTVSPAPPASPTQTATQIPVATPTPTTSAPTSAASATDETAIAGVEERIAAVENSLLPAMYLADGPTPKMALMERMAHYMVPGLSIAVIEDGKIDWANGYGVLEAGTEGPVDEETLFQAASISKAVTALVALRLAQSGKLPLDEDVSERLRSWELAETPLTAKEKVTLRRLLNHTAGTTVNGFAGYAPGEALPTTAQILAGEPPATSPPVRVRTTPGETWNYSGGGYVLIQQLIEDATGMPFAQVAQDEVLEPLGMARSAFSQPLAEDLQSNAASGHARSGQVLPGGWRVYPELAPAGLWSTPSDIARFAIALQDAARGAENPILEPELARAMLTPGLSNWGLGVQLGGPEDGRWFAHGGSNAGYRARMVAFAASGKGAVVMTNGDQGIDLFNEVLRAIADVYDWPDLKAQAKMVAEVDPEILESLAGRYDIVDDPGYGFDVEAAENALRVTTSDGTSVFQPESDLAYFDLESGLQIFFVRDTTGVVTGLETRLPTGSGVKAERVR